MNYLVYALVLGGSGNLYAGGRFDLAGGVPTHSIANWRGTNWPALGTGADSYGVQAVATDAGGTLHAGGAVTTAGGVTANHIAKWNGMSWSAFGTGGDANIMYALAVSVSAYIDAGGNFTIASGAIQTGGPTRTFSTDANYFYTGAAAQVTGAGLPPTVRNLTNATLGAPLTLSQPVTVR